MSGIPPAARRIFITGGASGLGRALALRAAREGWRVCIADIHEVRGAGTLPALRGAGAAAAEFVRCDVTRDEDLESARARLQELWGGVDVVVNNAGVALAGAIEDVTLEDWRWCLEINLLGVVRGCRVFTPVFKRQGHGHFVNVASAAGLLDVRLMSPYNASKAAVVSLSETLQNEFTGQNIGVTVACPSFFQTNLTETMRSSDPGLRTAMTKLLARSPLGAEAVADCIFDAMRRNQFYVLPHPKARMAWLLKRLLPRGVYTRLLDKSMPRIRPSSPAPPGA